MPEAEPERGSSARAPLWLRVFGIVVLIVVVLFIVVMLVGGGHRPVPHGLP